MPQVSKTLTALAGALLLSAATVQAQATGPTRVVSINPFLPLTGSFQGEFETRLRPNLAVAVAGSHISLGDDSNRYTNADVKLRLYPSERALEGFGIAAGLGVGRQSTLEFAGCTAGPAGPECTERRAAVTGPAFSVEMQYQWLLGRTHNTAVTVGGGAKRYYIDESRNGVDIFESYVPTLRLTVGYAFR